MRAINEAYAILHTLRSANATEQAMAAPLARPADHWSNSHRALSEEELNAIVRAIGDDSPVTSLMSFLVWFVPMVAAFAPIGGLRGGPPPTSRDWTHAGLLFSTGLGVLLFQKVTRRRKP